jgi:hypothetical protein
VKPIHKCSQFAKDMTTPSYHTPCSRSRGMSRAKNEKIQY